MIEKTGPDADVPLDAASQSALQNLLFEAIEQRNFARMMLCIERGARLERSGGLAHFAYNHYDTRIFKALVDAGMPVDERGHSGTTVLMTAVRQRGVRRVEELLALGASPLCKDDNGIAVLEMARNAAHPQDMARELIIDLLLKAFPPARRDFNAQADPVPDKPQAEIRQTSLARELGPP